MTPTLKHTLPYRADCSAYFSVICHEPWAIWLDSAGQGGETGRYDIMVARPHTTLVTRGENTEIRRRSTQTISSADPFDLLRRELASRAVSDEESGSFSGGAVGYFAYDLARRIERLPQLAEDDLGMPEMALGLYDWALVCDHLRQRCELRGLGMEAETHEQWGAIIAQFESAAEIDNPGPFAAVGPIARNMTQQQYCAGFERIQHYLQEGDCYQVNYAQRFSVAVGGSPWAAYLGLRRHNPAPFSAYLNTPYGQILSSSPERFLKLEGERVETRPIKGTRPRGHDRAEDERLAQALHDSEKDRAENLMIVDLLRNDLGKCCRTGSIRVPQLFGIEHYATVHHMVSIIEGSLSPGEDAVSLLRHAFPGGSITGAPKLRAMQIIEELEPQRRGIYCGSIGYIGYDGRMDSNIAIRTMLHKEGVCHFSAGGGIVRDSSCEEEYQESIAKAAGLLRLFEE